MLLLRTAALHEAADWLYELKHDGYRALAIKTSTQASEMITTVERGICASNKG